MFGKTKEMKQDKKYKKLEEEQNKLQDIALDAYIIWNVETTPLDRNPQQKALGKILKKQIGKKKMQDRWLYFLKIKMDNLIESL